MDACEVIELGDGCWLDLHRRAIPGHDDLFDLLLATTAWEQEVITLYGRRVRQPRLTAWFGVGMDSATRYRTTKPAHPWPSRLESILNDLRDHTGVPLNSALANLYRNGADAVAWHADDEPGLGPEPVIASVSLGGPRRFLLRRRDGSGRHELLLAGGDVLVMGGATQRLWLHAVPRTARPVEPRINLTFRAYDGGGDAPGLLSSGQVVIVDHDSLWALRYQAASRGLRAALGVVAVRVDHIGSTAVPGLAAKPIIDVQVSVGKLRPTDPYRTAIEGLGYLHRPHPEVADREFFRPPGPRTVHVHVVEAGSRAEREHLLLRDFLRAHPEAATAYATLKRTLAAQFSEARQDYQWGKDGFLQGLLVDAQEWATATSWAP